MYSAASEENVQQQAHMHGNQLTRRKEKEKEKEKKKTFAVIVNLFALSEMLAGPISIWKVHLNRYPLAVGPLKFLSRC